MVLDRVLKSDVDWEYHTLWLGNWKVVLMESIKVVIEIVILNEIEINGYCEVCMTLI